MIPKMKLIIRNQNQKRKLKADNHVVELMETIVKTIVKTIVQLKKKTVKMKMRMSNKMILNDLLIMSKSKIKTVQVQVLGESDQKTPSMITVTK